MHHPNIKIELTKTDWVTEIITVVGLIMTLSWVVIYYNELPSIIPTHFGATGEPDGYGNKWLLFLLPAIAVAIYLTATLADKFPQLMNYPIYLFS
jgi:uncharacterized membrane protein